MPGSDQEDRLAALASPVRDWFAARFPGGPTPAQRLAWPAVGSGEHLLLISPTGTGKTLAAFLAILDRLYREHAEGRLGTGLRCMYVSPLRSLGYDIERNLSEPLEAIRGLLGLESSPITVGVRTGDTSAAQRQALKRKPPHLLITTPESLALLLSQPAWHAAWQRVEQVIIDEVHALVATKRGADLAVSLERLAALAERDPSRLGLSATCRPAEPVVHYLVGPTRRCRVLDAERLADESGLKPALMLDVETLQRPGEAAHRGLTYRRLIRRLNCALATERTTLVFANTRALTEKLTHDLRRQHAGDAAGDSASPLIAAHHSALDAKRRRAVEAALKAGTMRAVVSSTSLELGVDIGSADLAVLVGLPGSVSRCLQRVGRSGHRLGGLSRGLILAAAPAELAGAAVTARAAHRRELEPLRSVHNPLDVLCQQLIGMACAGEWSADAAFQLICRAGPMSTLSRADFDDCLRALAGQLAAPAGAHEPEPGASPQWTAPRIWNRGGRFGLRSRRVARWLWRNIGTITSEESVRVLAGGLAIGTLEASYAERLERGDRFVLDGRALEFVKLDGFTVIARSTCSDPCLPRWSSDRQSLSPELARALAGFRNHAARLWRAEGCASLHTWLLKEYGLNADARTVLEELIAAQEQVSEVPRPGSVLVEEWPDQEGFGYAFHVPLCRSACEALGRATAARLGRRFGRNLALVVGDLGWSIQLGEAARLDDSDLPALVAPEGLENDVMIGLDRGELLARRFRHVASTALMVLRNPEGGRTRVGGLLWASRRLYPLLQAACPDHPLLRETRREVLEDLLDTPGAQAWLAERPAIRFRCLAEPSPFTAAWINPAGLEPLQFESPADALRRLHARLVRAGGA